MCLFKEDLNVFKDNACLNDEFSEFHRAVQDGMNEDLYFSVLVRGGRRSLAFLRSLGVISETVGHINLDMKA